MHQGRDATAVAIQAAPQRLQLAGGDVVTQLTQRLEQLTPAHHGAVVRVQVPPTFAEISERRLDPVHEPQVLALASSRGELEDEIEVLLCKLLRVGPSRERATPFSALSLQGVPIAIHSRVHLAMLSVVTELPKVLLVKPRKRCSQGRREARRHAFTKARLLETFKGQLRSFSAVEGAARFLPTPESELGPVLEASELLGTSRGKAVE
mmetsp:Transcript_24579/g.68429  ORF Transcript_24579/g.68429 Transcript_24579/m.68429 type:complete len:208 (-) Transcript_24579:415-1038(-)